MCQPRAPTLLWGCDTPRLFATATGFNSWIGDRPQTWYSRRSATSLTLLHSCRLRHGNGSPLSDLPPTGYVICGVPRMRVC